MSASSNLTEVLNSFERASLIDDHYTRQALHIPAAGVATDPLLTVEEVESYLHRAGFFDQVNVALRAPGSSESVTATQAATVFERLSRGDALQIVGLERVLPASHPVVEILRSLEQFCGASARGVTFILSPPGHSLPPHQDEFEVFTLQLSGNKRWLLYGFDDPDESEEGPEPSTTIDLCPGDFLYVPKLQAHHVLATQQVSASIAFVLQAPSWIDLLDELRIVVASDRRLFSSLPPDGVELEFESKRQALLEAVANLDASAFEQKLATQRVLCAQSPPDANLIRSFAIDALTPESLVCLRPGPLPILKVSADSLQMFTSHCDPIKIPLQAESALRFVIAAQSTFRITEICDQLDADSKLALIKKLARLGIVRTA